MQRMRRDGTPSCLHHPRERLYRCRCYYWQCPMCSTGRCSHCRRQIPPTVSPNGPHRTRHFEWHMDGAPMTYQPRSAGKVKDKKY